MPGQPLVSIAMPVYNGARTLPQAIRSILLQTCSRWELLLIDDGSTDHTLTVARDFKDPRITVLSDGEHQGLATRLNQAIDRARGDYLARMDSDDISFPDRIERQVSYLRNHPEVDLLGTNALVFCGAGRIRGLFPLRMAHHEICVHPTGGFYLPHPTWMGRIQWFRRFYYRTDVPRAEDQDLLLRSHEASRFASLPEVLLGYRQDSLPLRGILTGRYSFVKSVLREAGGKKAFSTTAGAVLGQAVKGLGDLLTVSLGLERVAFSHRALPVNDKRTIAAWRRCWDSCQA